jgi:hypothetical protein
LKKRLLLLSLIFPLLSWSQLNIKHATTQKVSDTSRGFATIDKKDVSYIFSYESKSKKNYQTRSSISYFQQLQLNDNKTLVMYKKDKKNKRTRLELDFFAGTKDVKAKPVNDQYIFITALTPKGVVKMALMDEQNKLRFSQSIPSLHVEKIHAIFSHLDGSYSLALKVNNQKNRMSYFSRGVGKSNTVIFKLSALLHLETKHFIGDTKDPRVINILKDSKDSYYVFSQTDKKSFSLYTHKFHSNETKKQNFNFKKEEYINAISTQDFSKFYLASHKNRWFTLDTIEKKIRSFEVAKVNGAKIISISALANNTILISGTFKAGGGDEDIFIHNYSAYESYLWGERYHSEYNDQVIKHKVSRNKIALYTLVPNKYNQNILANFYLDLSGKHTHK